MPRNCESKNLRLENWKSALRVGNWIERTLFKPGAIGTVVEEIERYNLGVVVLQEMRWQDTSSMQVNNTTLYVGAYDGRRQAGSGFAVNNKLLSAVKSFKVINPRLTILTMDTKWFKVVFVNVHAPTEDKDENKKEDF